MTRKIDSLVARCIEDLTPENWKYSSVAGGRFAVNIRIDIDSIENGTLNVNGNNGIKSTLYYYREIEGCVYVIFQYDTIDATITMFMDDSGIMLSNSGEGWLGSYCYSSEEEFEPVRIGHKIFYRGKYYKAGDEIPSLRCTIGGRYATYKR